MDLIIEQIKSRVKVLIVDDHIVLSRGMASLLSEEPFIEVVGIAKDGSECKSFVTTKEPDVILLDINLLDICGVDLISEIKQLHSQTKVIILTGHVPEGYVAISLRRGAMGIILKDSTKNELIEAINCIVVGKVYFSNCMAEFKNNELEGENHNPEILSEETNEISKLLTPREKEIMNLVSKGLTNNEIAVTLGLKHRTISFHISNILIKLGVNSRLKAAMVWKGI